MCGGVRVKDKLEDKMSIPIVQGVDGCVAVKSRDHI